MYKIKKVLVDGSEVDVNFFRKELKEDHISFYIEGSCVDIILSKNKVCNKIPGFRNISNLEFVDISGEKTRRYYYEGNTIEIFHPLALHISDSGVHKICNKNNKCYYINPGWKYIECIVEEDKPHFVK